MVNKYLIIGVTGVTCGGKTTLCKKLVAAIHRQNQESKFEINVKVLSQDDYFLDVEDKRHVWVEQIQHIHFDIISSLDMERMYKDVLKILASGASKDVVTSEKVLLKPQDVQEEEDASLLALFESLTCDVNVLLLEGFSIFEHEDIYKLCDLRYFFTLDYEECKRRRLLRVYEPPDCDGYFDVCVWPEYEKYLKLMYSKEKPSVVFFESNEIDRSSRVFDDIKLLL